MAVAPPQAAAAPDDPARPFATYNMQGGLGGPAAARLTAGAAANEYLARPNQATHQGGTEID
ncbi:hypothetical protein ACWELV_14710 [Streptomyces mirabilis]